MREQFICVVSFIIVLILVHESACHYNEVTRNLKRAGPQVYATQGQPWPKPQLSKNYGTFMIVRPTLFRFVIVNNTCDILEEALKRYYGIIVRTRIIQSNRPVVKNNLTASARVSYRRKNKPWTANEYFDGYLDTLPINMTNPCETAPHADMDEAYSIKIDTPDYPRGGFLAASTIWGILRGLETFTHLIYPTDDFSSLQIESTLIVDYPRFSYRSVLLDTSRHYLSKKVILQNLDLMAMNKFNVFHWHIVDDQSFPYQSKMYPTLSDKGAYHPYTHVYTQQDVTEIIEFARLRGIRVVPEFDTPGHTQSWGLGMNGLLTECYGKDGKPDGTFGPIDPTNEDNYDLLRNFFHEVASVFPDKYLHLGGDEVNFNCWKSNPNITRFMESRNWTDYSQLQGFYMKHLVDIIQNLHQNNSYVVWQEVVDNEVQLYKDAIVHVWINSEEVKDKLAHVTSLGYRTLFSACWYLDYISYGIDWHPYYLCDPQDFNGTYAQKRLVFGGGPAMWGEYVDSTNLISRLWPRAALPAERLWSSSKVNDTTEAEKRLEEHRCRLLKRGFNVEPANGPGYCLVSWD